MTMMIKAMTMMIVMMITMTVMTIVTIVMVGIDDICSTVLHLAGYPAASS